MSASACGMGACPIGCRCAETGVCAWSLGKRAIVRVKAWRSPDEDAPSFDIMLKRLSGVLAGPSVRAVLALMRDRLMT